MGIQLFDFLNVDITKKSTSYEYFYANSDFTDCPGRYGYGVVGHKKIDSL